MAGFDKSLSIAEWRWVMKKFHIGGELGTDRRVMYYPAGLCNGRDANCMPIQGAAGVRTPQMWMPAHMFIEAAKVSYNTNPDSLWQRERASVDKSHESASGSLTLGSDGKLSVKGLQRKLITKPSQAGWPPAKYISDWFQGIVGMADELEKVDDELQHTYSPTHTLPALCHQHRRCGDNANTKAGRDVVYRQGNQAGRCRLDRLDGGCGDSSATIGRHVGDHQQGFQVDGASTHDTKL